jgi:hypothetical protein
MSLKELKSIYDRNVLGVEGNKVGQNPPSEGNYFTNKGINDSPFVSKNTLTAGDDHMISLLTKKVSSLNSGESYKPSPNTSKYQDLDGKPGKQFQLGRDIASQKHIDSLTQMSIYTHGNSTEIVGPIPGGDSNSPFQDLDGVEGGNGYFHEIKNPGQGQGKKLGGKDLHVALLTKAYTYSHAPGFSTTILQHKRGPSGGRLDLNGEDGGDGYFHGIKDPVKGQGKKLGEKDLHVALLTKAYVYGKGKPENRITIGPSPGPSGFSTFQDLDGLLASPNRTLGQFGGPYKTTGPLDGFY